MNDICQENSKHFINAVGYKFLKFNKDAQGKYRICYCLITTVTIILEYLCYITNSKFLLLLII